MVDSMAEVQIAAGALIHNAMFRLSVQSGNTESLLSLTIEDFDSNRRIVEFHGHEGISAKRRSTCLVTLRGLLKVLSLLIRRVAIS